MRGKEALYSAVQRGDRITPAYAGKSDTEKLFEQVYTDHPRLCGEKCLIDASPCHTPGSPPPMRGKADRNGGRGYAERITPAYAGKSRQSTHL